VHDGRDLFAEFIKVYQVRRSFGCLTILVAFIFWAADPRPPGLLRLRSAHRIVHVSLVIKHPVSACFAPQRGVL
jgi:hypothetical protein